MSRRHLQTLIALVLAGLWGFGVYLGNSYGHLQFLDRAESAMIDLRTLVRGARVPPALLTIVAIDDATVNREAATRRPGRSRRIIDEIARLEPKVIAVDLLLVDKGPTTVMKPWRGLSRDAPPPLRPLRSSRPPVSRSPQKMTKVRSLGCQGPNIPAATEEIRRPCANRYRQRGDVSNRYPALYPDVVSNRQQD